MKTCPCDCKQPFENCCEPVLSDSKRAQTAEQLMRSRYTAYALGRLGHVLETWHADTRPETISPTPGQKWIGLKIKRTENGCATDEEGVVEFIARSRINGRGQRLHETSRFVRLDDRWYYVDGVIHDA